MSGSPALVPTAEERLAIRRWRPSWDLCVVALAGELDLATAATVQRLCDEGSPARAFCLVTDLSRLTFVDSTGIAALLRVANKLNARGGTMILAAPSAPVARAFETVGLGEFVVVAGSLEIALRCSGSSVGAAHLEEAPRRH